MKISKFAVTIALAAITIPGLVQAQKPMTPPHIMIVPDLIYCKAHGFVQTFDNNGVTEEIPDYEKALTEDPSLHGAITQIASLINQRNGDIVIIDLQECINNTKKDAALSSANGGDQSESIEEAIIRNSNADILIKLQLDLFNPVQITALVIQFAAQMLIQPILSRLWKAPARNQPQPTLYCSSTRLFRKVWTIFCRVCYDITVL